MIFYLLKRKKVFCYNPLKIKICWCWCWSVVSGRRSWDMGRRVGTQDTEEETHHAPGSRWQQKTQIMSCPVQLWRHLLCALVMYDPGIYLCFNHWVMSCWWVFQSFYSLKVLCVSQDYVELSILGVWTPAWRWLALCSPCFVKLRVDLLNLRNNISVSRTQPTSYLRVLVSIIMISMKWWWK